MNIIFSDERLPSQKVIDHMTEAAKLCVEQEGLDPDRSEISVTFVSAEEIRELNKGSVLAWRKRFRERLELIERHYPPRQTVDFEALADMAASNVEGGLILGRLLQDVTILPRQVLLYRDLVRAIFAPE